MKSERTAILLLVLFLLVGLGALAAYLRSDTNRNLQFPTPPDEVIATLEQQAAANTESAQALRDKVAQVEKARGELARALEEVTTQLEAQKAEVAKRNQAIGELNNVLTAKAADVTRLETMQAELEQQRDAARQQTQALSGQLQNLQAQLLDQQNKLSGQQSLLDELDQMAEEPTPAPPQDALEDEADLPLKP